MNIPRLTIALCCFTGVALGLGYMALVVYVLLP